MINKDILDFFYSKATNRIKIQYEMAHRPKQRDILPTNPKLLSYILNCKTTAKNNPYLITDGAIYALLESDYFQFNDESEILWGTEEEILSYLEDLFIKLWQEYIPAYPEIIESEYYQCDYLPFAKYLVLNNAIVKENNEFLEVLFGISKDEILSNYTNEFNKSIKYVFKRNENWFESEWLDFVSKTKTFTKLDKLIDSFVSEKFIPKLFANKPSEKSSLGIRVKNLLESDLSVKDKEIRLWGFENLEEKIKSELFKASLAYVDELERIFKMQNNDIR